MKILFPFAAAAVLISACASMPEKEMSPAQAETSDIEIKAPIPVTEADVKPMKDDMADNMAKDVADSVKEDMGQDMDKDAAVMTDETVSAQAVETAPTETLLYAAMTKWETLPFVEAVRAAELSDILDGDQVLTVFAPTRTAFDTHAGDAANMAAILKNHIVKGSFTSEDLAAKIPDGASSVELETLGDNPLTLYALGGGLRVAGANGLLAKIETADVKASNGVMHQINSVLLDE